MKIAMLGAALLLLGGCATYPGYQYADGYYRGEAVYHDAYPPAYGSGFDAYGWPYRSAFYGPGWGYGGYGGYGYGGYGYGRTVIYRQDHYQPRARRHHDHRHDGHWQGHSRPHGEQQPPHRRPPVHRPSHAQQQQPRIPAQQPERGHTDRKGRHIRQH